MAAIFTTPDVWKGGWYELAMELGEPNDIRLLTIHRTLWDFPDLYGCFTESDIEYRNQERLAPDSERFQVSGRRYGIATLPKAGKVACVSAVIREDGGHDWLSLGLPLGALETVYPVEYDIGIKRASWTLEIDEWLLHLGQHIYRNDQFRLGLVGDEVSGFHHADELQREGIPEQRCGILWPTNDSLNWYPPSWHKT